MKRASKEHVNEVVCDYLKRRNYTNIPGPVAQLTESISASALKMAVDTDTSSVGVMHYGCISEPSVCEQQFSRLVLFVKEAPAKHKHALMQTLYPLFLHIYIDMLTNGHRQTANRFYMKNKGIFINLPAFKTTVETISAVVNKCDQNPTLSISTLIHSELGTNKSCVSFNEDTLHYLLDYLREKDNMMILQIFHQNISIEIATDQLTDGAIDCMMSPPLNKTIHNEASLSSLKNAISQMRNLCPALPVITLHSVSGNHPFAVSGCLTADHIVVGCTDSSIKLWSRNGKLLKSISTVLDISKVHLTNDWIEDIDDCDQLNEKYEQRPSIVLRGHCCPIYDIKTFQDSPVLLSCSGDKTIRLWDLSTYSNHVIYTGHTQTVWNLAVGHQSNYFVSASKDRTAKLWMAERTHPLRVYVGHTMGVDAVKFHPNNNYIATGSQDKTVRLWSVQDGKCVRLMQGHKSNVLALAFSPDGKYLASAGEDRKIKIWDLASGSMVKEFKSHTDMIHCLEYTTEGSYLCSGGQDNTVCVWDTTRSSSALSEVTIAGSFSTYDNIVLAIEPKTQNVIEVIGAR